MKNSERDDLQFNEMLVQQGFHWFQKTWWHGSA